MMTLMISSLFIIFFINVFNEIRHGKALWKIFLMIAIFLFLIETWIGRPALNNNKK